MSFVGSYTEEQRLAIAEAYLDRGIRPAKRVVDIARAGELDFRGAPLPAFTTSESTVRSFAAMTRRRRAGKTVSKLAEMEHRDAVEALRRRLMSATDEALRSVERRQKRSKASVQWGELREAARCLRELAALPGPRQGRPVEPGLRGPDGTRQGGQSRGGLAGKLLAAHRAGPPNGVASAEPEPRLEGEQSDDDLVAACREPFVGQGAEKD